MNIDDVEKIVLCCLPFLKDFICNFKSKTFYNSLYILQDFFYKIYEKIWIAIPYFICIFFNNCWQFYFILFYFIGYLLIKYDWQVLWICLFIIRVWNICFVNIIWNQGTEIKQSAFCILNECKVSCL